MELPRLMVFEPMSFATAESLLLPQEREEGTLLIDMGDKRAVIFVYSQGKPSYYWEMPISFGKEITTDIAVNWRISVVQAQEIKRLLSGCSQSSLAEDDDIEIVRIKSNKKERIPRSVIAEMIQWRIEELFLWIAGKLQKTADGGWQFTSVVLTGDTSSLPGIMNLAEQVFNSPVRIASH